MPKTRPVIIIMVKAPSPGTVKTRLSPFLTSEQAAELAWCFLQDTTACALNFESNVMIAFAPADGRSELAQRLPENVMWHQQKDGDLGERLSAAIEFAAAQNFAPVIIIGADTPTVPDAYLQTAIKLLQTGDTDVVLGASTDGGFYLIGVRQNHPTLFDDIKWSSELVGAQTTANINRLKLKLSLLPIWYDVDTPEDLETLRAELLTGETAPERAPKTFQWLKTHSKI